MKYILLLITGFLILTNSVLAQSYYAENGDAVFLSKVPLHNFEGTSSNLVGFIHLEDSTVDFYLDLETLHTGIKKRDKDMKLTLETDKYPFAEFFGTLVSPFDSTISEPQRAITKGEFKIHGETKEVEIEGTLQKKENGLLLKASWVLNLYDYNIEPPRLLIIKVDENQEIDIEIFLTPSIEN